MFSTAGKDVTRPMTTSGETVAILNDPELLRAVIAAYRGSLEERYAVPFVRAIPELADRADLLTDEMIADVRAFFLEHLYPPPETRHIMDDAFDRMKDVLTSPRRLFALLGTAGRSLFRLGSMIPSAISAGLHTLEAVHEIRKLEGLLADRAHSQGITPDQFTQAGVLSGLVRALPPKDVVRFRGEMNKLFKHLSNIKLLDATIDILNDSRARMKERSDLFREEELNGLGFGLRILESGVALYRRLTPEQIETMHMGVNLIEEKWYDQIMAGA